MNSEYPRNGLISLTPKIPGTFRFIVIKVRFPCPTCFGIDSFEEEWSCRGLYSSGLPELHGFVLVRSSNMYNSPCTSRLDHSASTQYRVTIQYGQLNVMPSRNFFYVECTFSYCIHYMKRLEQHDQCFTLWFVCVCWLCQTYRALKYNEYIIVPYYIAERR